MIRFDFTGQTVLVTGGTRGIGAAVSQAFYAAGARVLALYGGNHARAEEFAARFADPSRLLVRCVDVADYAAVEAFFRELPSLCGTLEVLVNNAGIRRDGIVGMLAPEDWRAVLDTNLGGTYAMSKFAVQAMMTNRYGRIVNITSPSGRLGFAGQANYAASKAGQVAFAKSLAKEVAKRKITVNCVSPGFVETEFIAELPEEQLKEYRASVPLRRFAQPEEVAQAVLFLCSEEAAYITGTVLEISGGL
jgi:3-oxoacyl-[acyl-carrier protein] reductase